MQYFIKSIFSILLLICFSVYATSPISYAYHNEQIDKELYSGKQENSALNYIKLFFFSLLPADINHIETQEISPDNHFLIKKGKTLTEEKAYVQGKQTAEISSTTYGLSPKFIRHYSNIQSSLPKPHDDFLAFFTGLAPPLFNS